MQRPLGPQSTPLKPHSQSIATPSVVRGIDHFDGTEAERKRAIYVLVFLQTASRSEAEHASGLSCKALGRIISSLSDHGDMRERPRSGRPLTYTSAVMDAAYHALVEWDEGFPTGTDLMSKLVDQGVLERSVDVDLLLQHLKAHVKEKGHILIVDSTKTTFFLTAQDVVDRVKFASMMLGKLQTQESDMIIFVDETTVEESPHPKGEMGWNK